MISTTMKPKIAITMGDPAGVGPEVILKALTDELLPRNCLPFVIGDAAVLEEISRLIGMTTTITQHQTVDDIDFAPGTIPVLQTTPVKAFSIPYGLPDKNCGELSFTAVKTGVELAMSKQIAAIVTAPICKESWHLAGQKYDGHTGLLASLTKSDRCRMMFVSEKLNVILVTIHLALKEACQSISRQLVQETIEMGAGHLQKLGYEKPKVAVCGLNPHAGENGIFGNEEIDIIAPAVEAARASGILVEGPLSADTLFLKAVNQEFDLVVAQYHDQGLIPIKLVSFDSSVNITIGLPIIRTSVDHGTAFDIAGQGKADHTNLMAAINSAIRLSTKR